MEFQCNLCGAINRIHFSQNIRTPGPLCDQCKSSTRFRFVAYAISSYIFGGDGGLFKDEDNRLEGIGLSDAPPISRALSRFSNYKNTFYHKPPYLDIMRAPDSDQICDFLISSDVFEHTPPPVEAPFINAYSLLRHGGILILSVPTTNAYLEHFPELFDYNLVEENGKYRLVNTTRAGQYQEFDQLRFHGGPGSTLEMRIFSVVEVERNLKEAGFTSIERLSATVEAYGISPIRGLSTLWIARKT